MAKNKDPMEEIYKDIKKKFDKAVEDLAETVAFEIEKAYGRCIDAFYYDYEPVWYDRTYSTYLASSAADNPLDLIKKNGSIYTVGTEVSADNIPGNPYKASKDYVFERTFYKGIHGMNRNDYIKINKKRGKDYGKERIIIQNMPKNMNPTPEKMMNREFKKLTSKKNLDRLFAEKMSW